MGSLTRAEFRISLAKFFLMACVSKRSCPFLAMKVQRLTEPFPFPILTSCGFFVIGD